MQALKLSYALVNLFVMRLYYLELSKLFYYPKKISKKKFCFNFSIKLRIFDDCFYPVSVQTNLLSGTIIFFAEIFKIKIKYYSKSYSKSSKSPIIKQKIEYSSKSKKCRSSI